MTETPRRYRHFLLEGLTNTEAYKYAGGGGGSPAIPDRDRVSHGVALRGQIDDLRQKEKRTCDVQREAGVEDGLGLQVEFENFLDVELAFESLARERSGIELLNVRQEEDRTYATVFVPEGKLLIFENLIRAYLDESNDVKSGPRNHKLLNTISAIRAAGLQALWTDFKDAYPKADEGQIWWEVWLYVRENLEATISGFRQRAMAQGMDVAPGTLEFPERTVLLVRASLEQMQRSIVTLNSVAELMRPKEDCRILWVITSR